MKRKKATIFVLAILLSLNAPAVLCDSNRFTEEGKSEVTTMRVGCLQQIAVHTEDSKVSERPLVRSEGTNLSRENNSGELRILTKNAYFTSYTEKYSYGGISAAVENGLVNDDASPGMNVTQSDEEDEEKAAIERVKLHLEKAADAFMRAVDACAEVAKEVIDATAEGVKMVVKGVVDLGKVATGFIKKLRFW